MSRNNTNSSKWEDMAFKMSIEKSAISTFYTRNNIPHDINAVISSANTSNYKVTANLLGEEDFTDSDFDISKIESMLKDVEEQRNVIREETKEIMSKIGEINHSFCSFEDNVLEAMMRDFETEVLPVIEENPDLERLVFHFIKLRDALIQYHRNEKQIVECCKELQKEHSHMMVKFKGMFRLSIHDRQALVQINSKFVQVREQLESTQQSKNEKIKTIEDLKEVLKEKETIDKIKTTQICDLKKEISNHISLIQSLKKYVDFKSLPTFIKRKLISYDDEKLDKNLFIASSSSDKNEQFQPNLDFTKYNKINKKELNDWALKILTLTRQDEDELLFDMNKREGQN